VISLKRLNGTEFVLNAELIEQIERTPDTVITLTTGNNIVVQETVEEVVQRIIEYRQKVVIASVAKKSNEIATSAPGGLLAITEG